MVISTDMLEDVRIPAIAQNPGGRQYAPHTVQSSLEDPLPRTLLSIHGPSGNSSPLHDPSLKSLAEEGKAQTDINVEEITKLKGPQLVEELEPTQKELEMKDADIETILDSAPLPPENIPHQHPTVKENGPVEEPMIKQHEKASEFEEILAVDVKKVCVESPCIPAIEVPHVPTVEDTSVPVEVSLVDADGTVVSVSDTDIVTEVPRLPEEELGLKRAVGDFFSNILPITKTSENLPSTETVVMMTPVVLEPDILPSPCPSEAEKEDVKSPSAIDKFFRKFSNKSLSTEPKSPAIVEVPLEPENTEVSKVSNHNVFEEEPLPYVPGKCSIGPLDTEPKNGKKSAFDKFVDIFSKAPDEDASKEELEECPAEPLDVPSVDVSPTAEPAQLAPTQPVVEHIPLEEITVDIPLPVPVSEELEPPVEGVALEEGPVLVKTPVTATTAVDVLGDFFSNILPITKPSEYHPKAEKIPTHGYVNIGERPTIPIEAEAQFPPAAIEIKPEVPNGHYIDESQRSSAMDQFLHRFSITPDHSSEDEVVIGKPVTPVVAASPISDFIEKEMVVDPVAENERKSAFGQLIGIFSKPEDDFIKETPVMVEPASLPNLPPTESQTEKIQSSDLIKDGELEVDSSRKSGFGGFFGKIDVAFFHESNDDDEQEENVLKVDPVLITETEDAPKPDPKKIHVSEKMSDFFTGMLKPLIREKEIKKTRTIIRIKSSLGTEEVEVIESLTDFIKKDILKKIHGDDDPFVVCDISDVFERKLQWDHQFPGIIMFYNLDAFNALSIRVLLNVLHCGFVCSNWCDIKNCLRIGVSPQKIVYQQPFKEKATIRHIVARGILIVCYSTSDLKLIGELALELEVKSNVLIQVDVSDGAQIQHPVVRGVLPADMNGLITEADRLGVTIIGISLDVSTGMSMDGCIMAKEAWEDLDGRCSPSLLHIGGLHDENDPAIDSELITRVLLEHFEDVLYSPNMFVIGDLKGYLTKTSVSLVSCITESKEVNGTLHLALNSHITNELWDSKPYVIPSSKDIFRTSPRRTAVWDTSLGPPVILENTFPSMRLGDWVVFSEAREVKGKVKRRFVCSEPHDKEIKKLLQGMNESMSNE